MLRHMGSWRTRSSKGKSYAMLYGETKTQGRYQEDVFLFAEAGCSEERGEEETLKEEQTGEVEGRELERLAKLTM